MASRRAWPLVALLAAALPLACSGILGIHDIGPPSDGGHKDGSAGDVREEAVYDVGSSDATDATWQDTSADVTPDTPAAETSDGPPAACSVDGGGAALGVPGCPCSPPGTLACAGHAQPVTLLCGAAGVWVPSSTCPSGDLCDSRPGPSQGTCAPIDPLCTGLMPGASVCSDNVTVAQCGPDLVSHSPATSCINQACLAGLCTGVCTPFTTQSCATYNSVVFCTSNGMWQTLLCTEPKPDCAPVPQGGQLVPECVCLGSIVATHCDEPVKLFGPTNDGWHVAVDSTSVYWSEVPTVSCDGGTCGPNHDGTIKKTPLGGGSATTLVSGLGSGVVFRINSAGLYWVAPSCPADAGPCTDTLWSEPLAGGTATAIGPVQGARDFVVDATNAYVSINATAIVQVPLDGSPPTTLASSPLPQNVAVDSSTVYFTDYTRGAVYGVPIGGGGAVPLAASTHGSYIAVDASYVYWLDSCPDAGTCYTLLRAPIGGGAAIQLATPSSGSALLLYGGNVYFSDQFNILSVPVGGGTVTTLATPRGSVFDIAVDATDIYYADLGGYGVWKLPRP